MTKKRNSALPKQVSTSNQQVDKKDNSKSRSVLKQTNLEAKRSNFENKSSIELDAERNNTLNSASAERNPPKISSSLENKKTKKVSATIQKYLHKMADVGINKTFICCKESYIESPTSFYGCFYLGPFPESLSLTLSHNLRRTLLSEIPGLAITAVEIDGVLHQYSNIPGIKETVLDILSNLQNIVFVKTRLANSFVAFLKVRGPGVVKASDIRLPAGVALVNPDQYIATLAEGPPGLNMKIWIHEGKNAIKQKPQNPEESSLTWETSNSFTATTSLEEEETNLHGALRSLPTTTSLKSNKLYLDSVFMPVTKVNSFVETNFKATDDPAKTAPFVFREDDTTSLIPKSHSQRASNISMSLDNNHDVETSRSESFGNKARRALQKTSRPNYFDFLSAEQQTTKSDNTRSANYLVLAGTKSNMSEVANFESDNLTNLESASTILGLPKSLLNSRTRQEPNPILMSPVTYNQPAKQCHIVLEIWTNGSIHPRQALKECLAFLTKTFIGLSNVKILGSMYKSHMTYQKVLKDL